MFIETLHLLLWMESTSPSPVQTTVGDMEIASLECVSVIWDTQVMRLKDGVETKRLGFFMFHTFQLFSYSGAG